jgi:hypothetical protein
MTVNLWAQFDGLLPKASRIVAQVVTVDTDGSTIVEQPGGQQFKALGGAGLTTGDWVYVQAGEIRGEAPALSLGVALEV